MNLNLNFIKAYTGSESLFFVSSCTQYISVLCCTRTLYDEYIKNYMNFFIAFSLSHL